MKLVKITVDSTAMVTSSTIGLGDMKMQLSSSV